MAVSNFKVTPLLVKCPSGASLGLCFRCLRLDVHIEHTEENECDTVCIFVVAARPTPHRKAIIFIEP
jgi:hypothetical protein